MKPYLYKWTKLKARFNFLTGLKFVTRQSSAMETDIGTAESIAKIIVLHTDFRAKVLHIPEKVFKLQIARLCNCNETDFDLRNWRSILPLIVNSLEPLSYSEMWRIKNPQKSPLKWLTPPMLRTLNKWPLKVEKTSTAPWQRCIAPPRDVMPTPSMPPPSAPSAPTVFPAHPTLSAPSASTGPSTSSTREFKAEARYERQISRTNTTTDSTSVRNSIQDLGFENDIFISDASDDELLSQI